MDIEATVRAMGEDARRTMEEARRIAAGPSHGDIAEHRFYVWEEAHTLRESHGVVLSLSRRIPWHGTHEWVLGQPMTLVVAETLSMFAGMPTTRQAHVYHRIHGCSFGIPRRGETRYGFAYDADGQLVAISRIPQADGHGAIGPSIPLWSQGQPMDANTVPLAACFRRRFRPGGG